MARSLFLLVAPIVLCLAACSQPDLDRLEKGERGKVSEIADGDTLVMGDGLRVTLTEIEAPFGDQPYAGEARAGLERLALNREARLAYGGLRRLAPRTDEKAEAAAKAAPKEPGPETALAQVFVRSEGGRWIWLQQAMVSQGFARVRTRKENHARVGELLAAEAQARAARRGLWALPAYRVLNAAAIERQTENLPTSCGQGPFLLVEGRVRDVSASDTRVYLNFGGPEDYRTDFTIGVYGDAVAEWRARGPGFESYQNKQVRVRGRAANRGGPLICADHPEQIEILNPAPATRS